MAGFWFPSTFEITCTQSSRVHTYRLTNPLPRGESAYPEEIEFTLRRIRRMAERDGFDVDQAWWRVTLAT